MEEIGNQLKPLVTTIKKLPLWIHCTLLLSKIPHACTEKLGKILALTSQN